MTQCVKYLVDKLEFESPRLSMATHACNPSTEHHRKVDPKNSMASKPPWLKGELTAHGETRAPGNKPENYKGRHRIPSDFELQVHVHRYTHTDSSACNTHELHTYIKIKRYL